MDRASIAPLEVVMATCTLRDTSHVFCPVHQGDCPIHYSLEPDGTCTCVPCNGTSSKISYPRGFCRTCGTVIHKDIPYEEQYCALHHAAIIKAEIAQRTCGTCGGHMAYIRGRHPQDPRRWVCPTCTVERLEQIHDIASPDYGKAFTSQGVLKPIES